MMGLVSYLTFGTRELQLLAIGITGA